MMKVFVLTLGIFLLATPSHSFLSVLLKTMTLKELAVEGVVFFNNMMHDIVEDAFQSNPELYKTFKPILDQIRENTIANMRFITSFTTSTTLWSLKEAVDHLRRFWIAHGKDILEGNFDKEYVHNVTLQYLDDAKAFLEVHGLGFKPKIKKPVGTEEPETTLATA